MEEDKIIVRLVPKNRQGYSLSSALFSGTSRIAKEFLPDIDKANQAFKTSMNMGVKTAITSHASIHMEVSKEQFNEIFQNELVEKKIDSKDSNSFVQKTSFQSTNDEVKVPSELSDLIDFAYIPNPVHFFSQSFVPPRTSLYHLGLLDVLRSLNGSQCHRNGWTGKGVRVAMADSGFAKHPYFESQGYNMNRISTPGLGNPLQDSSGHGTGECANVLIVAPDCEFVGIKHNDYSALALETSLDQNPNIITNSWGWNIDNRSKSQIRSNDRNQYNEIIDIENIISDAIDDGVVVIFSAGNGHRAFPGSMDEVLSIGGVLVNRDGSFEASNYASSFVSQMYPNRRVPDVCGIVGSANRNSNGFLPGHIMLPVPNGSQLEGENLSSQRGNQGWGMFSGTSASAPQVAGIVALMLSINPNLSQKDVKSILEQSARDVTKGRSSMGDQATVGVDLATGAGFVDAALACQLAEKQLST